MLTVAMGERVPDEYAAFTNAQLGQRSFLRDREIAVREGSRPSSSARVCPGCAPRSTCTERASLRGHRAQHNRWWRLVGEQLPGAGVDTPNHLYSYSFAPRDWRHYFCLRDEILDYLEDVSRDFDVRRFITSTPKSPASSTTRPPTTGRFTRATPQERPRRGWRTS